MFARVGPNIRTTFGACVSEIVGVVAKQLFGVIAAIFGGPYVEHFVEFRSATVVSNRLAALVKIRSAAVADPTDSSSV